MILEKQFSKKNSPNISGNFALSQRCSLKNPVLRNSPGTARKKRHFLGFCAKTALVFKDISGKILELSSVFFGGGGVVGKHPLKSMG